MTPRAILTLAALLVLGASAAAAPEGGKEAPPGKEAPAKELFKDEVAVRGARGPSAGVEVVYEGWDRVEWKSKSGPVPPRSPSEILSVKYGDQPPHFARALDAFRAGRWSDAETEFRGVTSAVSAGRARKFWAARADAYIGECRRRQAAAERSEAKYKEAAEAFLAAARAEPKSPLAEMIQIGLADAQAGGRDWDAAFKTLDDFRKTAGEAGRPLWEARSRLTRGRLLELKGEVGGAAQEYQELASFCQQALGKAAPDSPDRPALEGFRTGGLVSQGWALYARAEKTKNPKDLEEARKFFEGLPAATGGAVAGRAASMNGTGGILLLEGKAQKALERFIEVEVTMFAVPEEVARALWYKAQSYERLGNSAGREQALKDLSEFYPWSEWAGRAR